MTERCKRCKRIIKNPTSVIHGYGPSCWKKVPHSIVSNEIINENTESNSNVYMSIK